MNTKTVQQRLITEVVGIVAGLATIALLMEVVGTQLFTRALEQGPLSIVVVFPGALAVGASAALVTRRLLRGDDPKVTASAAALGLAGVTHIAVGGVAGVYSDVANSPFRDLVIATGLGLVAGVFTAVLVYRRLTSRDDRPNAIRGLVAVLAAIVAGIGGAVALFVSLTAALDPYIWPAPIVTGPVAIVAGFIFAVLAYRSVSQWGANPEV